MKRSRRRNRRMVPRENPLGIGTAIMSGVGTLYAIGVAYNYFTQATPATQQTRVKNALLWPVTIFSPRR